MPLGFPAVLRFASPSLSLSTQAWEGKGVVASARKLIGATNPLAAEPGTIRGDFAVDVGRWVDLPLSSFVCYAFGTHSLLWTWGGGSSFLAHTYHVFSTVSCK